MTCFTILLRVLYYLMDIILYLNQLLRASERCHQEKRKTINGEDILFAMQTLGFDNYVEPLKLYLQKYRESIKGEKSTLPSTTEGREDLEDDDHSLPQFQVGQ